MKPIAVIQHDPAVQPGYFTEFLAAQGIPWQHFDVGAGDSLPDSARDFAGLCSMGGPMSVNDPLPWIDRELALIRDAIEYDIPVIGHCLGGQLMSRALGGTVGRNPVREIGWSRLRATAEPAARAWLGDIDTFDAYQWHNETFSLPAGAIRILTGAHCANQAFVLGPHLAMQFHVEMTETLIRRWNADWADEFATGEALPSSVQPPARQEAELPQALPRMRQVAQRLYTRWVAALAR